MILKLLGTEIDIGSTANTVSNATLVRVINTGAAAVCNVANSGGSIIASATVANTQYVILQKSATDKLIGSGMKAVPVAYKN